MITQTQQQTKTLPASQVKNTFGTVVNQVQNGTFEAVIVENHGEPVVAIVAIEELQAMKEFKEQEKRRKALAMLRQAREEVQARLPKKLSDKEAMQIADQFSHELVEDLAKEGKVKFERKSS